MNIDTCQMIAWFSGASVTHTLIPQILQKTFSRWAPQLAITTMRYNVPSNSATVISRSVQLHKLACSEALNLQWNCMKLKSDPLFL